MLHLYRSKLILLLTWFLLGHLPSVVFAQGPLDDEVSLSDPSIYKNPEKARFLLVETQELIRKDPEACLKQICRIYDESAAASDFETQAIAAITHSAKLNELGRLQEAVEWAARADALDSLFPPLAPSRQYLHNALAAFYGGFGTARIALPHSRLSMEISWMRDRKMNARLFRNVSAYAINLKQAGDVEQSLHYHRVAIEVARQMGDDYWYASGLNNYGFALQEGGNHEAALLQLREAEKSFRQSANRDTAFLGAIVDNQAKALLGLGKTEEALRLFEANWLRFSHFPDTMRWLNAGLQRTQALLQLGRTEEAGRSLAEVAAIRAVAKDLFRNRTMVEYLRTEMQLAAAQGRLQAQLAAQQKLLRLTDSLAYQAGQSKVQAMESLIEGKGDEFRQKLDVARLRNAESAARARYRGMLAVAIFLASAMLVGVLLMLQRRRMGRMRAMAERQRLRRAQAELRLQQEQLEKERIHRQLELKQKDITDLAMDISLKRRITNELVERLKRLKASPNPVRDIQEMIMTLRGQTEHEVQSRLTPENIDLVNHAFYEKLKATYPGLTSAEMDLCGLLRMRLGSKEIGALRNITAHSVRVSKYRLKKKLGLGKDEDLVEVLQRL